MNSIAPHGFGISWLARGERILLVLLALGLVNCTDPYAMGTSNASPPMPLGPPSPPTFILPQINRAVGAVQNVPENQVQIMPQSIPARMQVVETFIVDSDTVIRAQSQYFLKDDRSIDHRDSTRRAQGLGVTGDGFYRLRVDYPRSGSMSLEQGRTVSKADPVERKAYFVDIGTRGIRVLTEEGLTPPAAEVEMIQEDHEAIKIRPEEGDSDGPLRKRGAAESAPTGQNPTEYLKAQILKGIQRNGQVVEGFSVRFLGVRDVDGAPCAAFQVGFTTQKQRTSNTESTWIKTSLAGEYSIRIADGWDAEVYLSGWSTKTIQRMHEGIPITISTAGSLRLYWRTIYLPPDPQAPHVLEKLDR